MEIKLSINGQLKTIHCPAGEFLATTLRANGFLGVKEGCDTSSCGLCTVWLDKKPVLSCSLLTARAAGHEITTIEGVQDKAHEFATFMVSEGAEQCGYCSPGFTMTVIAMKDELGADASDEEINHYLAGNLCRCSGYKGQLRSIKKYLRGAK